MHGRAKQHGRAVTKLVLTQGGADGRDSIALAVTGYEFPGKTVYESDANWLVLRCTKQVNGRRITGAEPCLQASEVCACARQLMDYRAGGPDVTLVCMEPNFRLNLFRKEGENRLELFFWAEQTGEDSADVWPFCKALSDGELEALTAFFCSAMRQYPLRLGTGEQLLLHRPS